MRHRAPASRKKSRGSLWDGKQTIRKSLMKQAGFPQLPETPSTSDTRQTAALPAGGTSLRERELEPACGTRSAGPAADHVRERPAWELPLAVHVRRRQSQQQRYQITVVYPITRAAGYGLRSLSRSRRENSPDDGEPGLCGCRAASRTLEKAAASRTVSC